MPPGWATKGSYAMLATIAVFLALFSLTQRIRPGHGLLFRPRDSAAGEEAKTACAAEQAATLAAGFHSLLSRDERWTSCPSNSWMAELQDHSPSSKVVIDIGCNKGYSSATLFALWAADVGFNPQTLGLFLGTTGMDSPCGVCDDCTEEIKPKHRPLQDAGLHVLCVEPSLSTFKQLTNAHEHFLTGSRGTARWDLLQAAVSNISGLASFPRCPGGSETCSLSDASTPSETDMVRIVTVDELLQAYSLRAVDILKIDTEGYDMAALLGAAASLKAGIISVVVFEYHAVGLWTSHSLHEAVSWLRSMRYICYFDGKESEHGSLVRLTGCWHDSYEIRWWSNVVCVHRDHASYGLFERMSTRASNRSQHGAP